MVFSGSELSVLSSSLDSSGEFGSGFINLELTCAIRGSTRDFMLSKVGGTFSRTDSKVKIEPYTTILF